MVPGLKKYICKLIHSYLYDELINYCPDLCPGKRRYLEDLTLQVSKCVVSGHFREALLQYRDCLILLMRNNKNVQQHQLLQTNVISIPCGTFKFGGYDESNSNPRLFKEPYDPKDTIQECDTFLDAISLEMIHRFRATSQQVLKLSPKHKEALLKVLTYHITHSPLTCPITLETLLDEKGLKPDVVALVEMEILCSIHDAHLYLNSEKSVSVITLQEKELCSTDLLLSNQLTKTKRHTSSSSFATVWADRTVRQILGRIKRLLSVYVYSYPSESSTAILNRVSSSTRYDSECLLSHFINSRPYLSLTSSPSLHCENLERRSLRLWTLKRQDTIPENKVSSPQDQQHNHSTLWSSSSSFKLKTPLILLIRCHLFNGSALLQWFDTGQWVNPITRTPVSHKNWCRLTPLIMT